MIARAADLEAPPSGPWDLWRRRTRELVDRGDARRRVRLVIASSICVLAIVFGILLEQVVLAQSAFRLAELRTRLAEAETRHEELLLQAARLASPERIERYARDVLGMVDATTVEYIVADIPGSTDRPRGYIAAGQVAPPTGTGSAWVEEQGASP